MNKDKILKIMKEERDKKNKRRTKIVLGLVLTVVGLMCVLMTKSEGIDWLSDLVILISGFTTFSVGYWTFLSGVVER